MTATHSDCQIKSAGIENQQFPNVLNIQFHDVCLNKNTLRRLIIGYSMFSIDDSHPYWNNSEPADNIWGAGRTRAYSGFTRMEIIEAIIFDKAIALAPNYLAGSLCLLYSLWL